MADSTTSKSLHEKHDHEHEIACGKVVRQNSRVSVPVSVHPFAIPGKIRTKCCGEPKIIKRESKDSCDFIITQELSVEVPIQFGALTETYETDIDCEKPTVEGCE
ncbi:hypothetical protein [Haloplasma contractile]|uniref:Uncharacterized protein n=1 Tax=Haloplasma contractile SSD-17B TaxID=1033810 RepID=U2DS58_9MOLU|nr:hypothetical protein [Haloplasma contractile]ERJ11387.1 hypothetical protein HLPCO_002509 [Haloplasma contractile SSD-17B]